jgi:hypothetical protein
MVDAKLIRFICVLCEAGACVRTSLPERGLFVSHDEQ